MREIVIENDIVERLVPTQQALLCPYSCDSNGNRHICYALCALYREVQSSEEDIAFCGQNEIGRIVSRSN